MVVVACALLLWEKVSLPQSQDGKNLVSSVRGVLEVSGGF